MSTSINEGEKYIMPTYGRFPLVITHGKGCYVYDEEHKKYLDMCAGIAVNLLGYGHEKLTKALQEQVTKLLHISNLYYNPNQIEAAQLLVENTLFDKVFFCNSGAEANEAAMKLARKYGKDKNRTQIITMKHSFHGRTCGALTATGQEKYQKYFLPLLPDVVYADYNNIESLKALMSNKTCAVLIEVIQGEGGIIPAEKEYLKQVNALCKANDVLLMIDEVQTGMGRTGKLFAFEHYGIQPDIVTTAKGLGGGVPIGAMLCTEAANVFVSGDHASTFGGNPLATKAAEIVLKELMQTSLLEHVEEMGHYLTEQLTVIKEAFHIVKDVRGIGLMQGIEVDGNPRDIVNSCIEKGMLVVSAGTNVVRFVPPLVITKEHIDEAMGILKQTLAEYCI